MAQSKVSDFFSTRKNGSGQQPSKRRKLNVDVESETNPEFASPPLACRTRSRKGCVSVVPSVTQSQKRNKQKVNKKRVQDSCQRTILDAFKQTIESTVNADRSNDIATAALDDHNASPPCSPSKHKVVDATEITTKRSRVAKPKDLLTSLSDVSKTPERGFDFSRSVEKESTCARKRLVLKSPKAKQDKPPVETNKSKTNMKEIDTAALKMKLLKDGKFAEMQEKLAQYSRTKAQLSSPVKKQKPKILSSAAETSCSKAPAYERFHSLAEAIPPTLGLPFKYKLLAEMFRGVDTVVSMLHKRSETCTFSKLKAAVQQLLRKNFEEKNLGQIRTVYPTAYVYRQEKGLHALTSGGQSNHQLTVEANLETPLGQKEESVQLDKYGKPVFTASHLTARNTTFHRNLINIVKTYHQDFLAKLEKPLKIDNAQIKRWHPQFKLDSVPDIEPSALPQPPDVKRLTTAAEVLEHAKSSLNPRIQRALKLAAGQVSPKKSVPEKNGCGENKIGKKPTIETNKNLSGVSQSLLERIRAKESAKTAAAMLRSPEEEARLKRIERLPELARILRTVYVTQKKPALLLEEVISKLGESYKSNMGKAESEKHVLLLVELVPDWLQIVQIKRGKFIKMDRNKDLNVIQNKLVSIFKTAK